MLVVNPALCELTGRTADELVGRHLDLLTHPDDPPVGDRGLDRRPGSPLLDPQLQVVGERRLRRADGESIWVHPVAGARPPHQRRAAVRRPHAGRRHRPAPRRGGPGPPRLHRPADRAAQPPRADRAAAARPRRSPAAAAAAVGLLHLDLDRFTAVNDSLGHEGGDQLLCQVADRLRWSTRVEDTAVRFGADEFLVLADEVEDVDGLRTLADRLLGVLDEPFHVHDREITLSASVGMTLGSDLAPEALLRQAHSALARAKASGGRGRIEVHDEAARRGLRRPAAAGDRPAARARGR